MTDLINPFVRNLQSENAIAIVGQVDRLRKQGRDVLSLAAGQPDFPTPPSIVAAAEQSHRDGHFGYTPAPGIMPLREAVAADLLTRHGVEPSPEHVLIVPGGKVTMTFAMMILGQPGTEIIYPDPGFPIYKSVILGTGATPVAWTLEPDHHFRAERLASLLNARTRLVIINTPHNPTSRVIGKAELDRIVSVLECYPETYILSDEIYSTLCFNGEPFTSLLTYPQIRDRLILLDGWSKRFAMTGWRMGYSVWPSELFGYALKLAVNFYSCVNAPAQYAGLAALTLPVTEQYSMAERFAQRNRSAYAALRRIPGLRCPEPQGAFYVFPSFAGLHDATGQPLDASDVEKRLLREYDLAVVSGTSFGSAHDRNIRLSTASEEIDKGISRLQAFFEDNAR